MPQHQGMCDRAARESGGPCEVARGQEGRR